MVNIEGKTKRKSVKLRDCVHKIVRILLLRVCCMFTLFVRTATENESTDANAWNESRECCLYCKHKRTSHMVIFFFSFLMTRILNVLNQPYTTPPLLLCQCCKILNTSRLLSLSLPRCTSSFSFDEQIDRLVELGVSGSMCLC